MAQIPQRMCRSCGIVCPHRISWTSYSRQSSRTDTVAAPQVQNGRILLGRSGFEQIFGKPRPQAFEPTKPFMCLLATRSVRGAVPIVLYWWCRFWRVSLLRQAKRCSLSGIGKKIVKSTLQTHWKIPNLPERAGLG